MKEEKCMREEELVEQIKQLVLHAEQEAMKQSLNAKAEHKQRRTA